MISADQFYKRNKQCRSNKTKVDSIVNPHLYFNSIMELSFTPIHYFRVENEVKNKK